MVSAYRPVPFRPSVFPDVFFCVLIAAGLLPSAIVRAEPAEPPHARRMTPDQEVWVDASAGRVYVGGRVVLREGVLEMFACPAQTKEHESIVAVDAKGFLLHTSLLAIGAEPGTPVRFEPHYKPPTGTPIAIQIEWTDADGVAQTARAQDWIRHIDTGEAMELPFVFVGSSLWTDPQTGQQHYLADAGDLVCVSNFGTALLDVPAASTQSNEELLFEPFTERIPPVGTPVRLIFSIAPVNEPGGEAPTTKTGIVASPATTSIDEALAKLAGAAVGTGSTPALREAWQAVAQSEPAAWPNVLQTLSDASPLAANWLRSALAAASETAKQTGLKDQEAELLRQSIRSTELSNLSRRTAYELLIEHRPDERETLLETLADDRDEELRYDAVQLLLERAAEAGDEPNGTKSTNREAARAALYRVALSKARVLDQVEAAAAALEDLGEKQTLTDIMGFVTAWRLIGPFDNTAGAGFSHAEAPEKSLSADVSLVGKPLADGKSRTLTWSSYTSRDRLGEVDLNTGLAAEQSSVGYAWATLTSDTDRDIEVRYTSRNATKVWVNGDLIAENEIYHDGSAVDQYRAQAKLNAGANNVLIKVCQNNQPEPWAKAWGFQLRVCDATGGRIEGVTALQENP
ncbi:hypothetical protein Pla111_33890 [Botrimarina hoheduenensis]|uniref:Uncharacterized protein n=2 Tax=Botrimarina hoheduenensis TaxID=2528000 RepID=A0A5C5VQ32_9BACT|nr:hypothetical protein Pla111_33890 [Botrimarina hoheduenensis]